MARKKLQKLFALLLTFSMTMSLLGVTAFAEDEEDNVIPLEVGKSTTIGNYKGVSQQDREKYTNHQWETSDSSVATVKWDEETGDVTVTGVGVGKVTITHRYNVVEELVPPQEQPPAQIPEPTTQEPTTQEPTTQEPTTPEPTTPEPTTPEPTTPELTTQEPTTQEPTTQEQTVQTAEAALVFNDPLDPGMRPEFSETWTFEVTAPEQETPEIPEETCDVEYKSTSQGVSYTGGFNETEGRFEITVTIDETANGDLALDLSDMVMTVMNEYAADYGFDSYPVQPGGTNPFQITIQNNSGHTYRYKSGSFVLSTADAHNYEQTNVLGYDGQLIPRIFVAAISVTSSKIYQKLFGVKKGQVTAEMLFDVYGYLAKNGYTGDDAFTRFAKDQNLSPDDLAVSGNNGIFKLTADELASLEEKYPHMVPYVYADDNGDGTLDVQIKWPEPELAAMSYNVFYQDYWSFAFGEEEMAQLNPNRNTSFTRTRGIGDYMPGTDLYAKTDAYLTASLPLDTAYEGGDTLVCMMAFDGPGISNGYMNYQMAFYMALELEQLDTSYTVRHEYYTNGKLTGSTESDPVTGLLGDTVSVADIEKMLSYQGGDYEYTSTTPNEPLTLTSNVEKNVIVLRYDRTVEVEEPTFEWDISKSKTATPLDEDLKSQVTLSLPSAEETLESDIVFVVDKSTSSRDESTEGGLAMLEALNSSLESTKAVINVGIVVFDGTYHVMRELSPYDAADVAEKMSAVIPLEEDTSGTNIEAGLLAAQAMLEEHTSVANNRKYVILVSDGLTRLFTGPDGETVQIIFNQLEADGTRYFGEYTTWCLSNRLGDGEYKVPGGVDWLTYYTTVIKPQVEADGDTYVMDFTGASTMTDTVPEKYIPLDEVQDHAQAIDRAFYDAYQAYLDLSTAYHCYAIYTGSSELGSSFMSTLSNGETLDFGDIQNDILYAVDKGSHVVDYIGYVAGSYDFDFVNDVSAMSLKVGETTYPAVRLTDNRYGFKPVGDGTYAFTLEYERGNGLNEERFTWHIGEAVSNFAPVQLTYTVKLVTPPTEPGDYKLDTNQSATLHPVNSDGTPGDPEDFEKPTVDYTVGGGTGPEGPGTDPTPPGGTDPTPPGGDGGTDIPDGNTPTTDLPDQETPTTELPEEETPTTELPEEETPLAEVPETGDMSALWLAMTALSGTGLAGVTFLGRKKRDEE